MAIQQILFQSIPIDNQSRALEFYTSKLGMKVHTDAPYGENYRWIFLEIPGAETRLRFAKREEISVSHGPVLCLVSDNVDLECERLLAQDVEITDGPAEAPWKPGVRWAMIKDTEGNLILIESFEEGAA